MAAAATSCGRLSTNAFDRRFRLGENRGLGGDRCRLDANAHRGGVVIVLIASLSQPDGRLVGLMTRRFLSSPTAIALQFFFFARRGRQAGATESRCQNRGVRENADGGWARYLSSDEQAHADFVAKHTSFEPDLATLR